MPELAEVETVVRKLKSRIEGKTIQKITISDSKVVPYNFSTYLPLTIKHITRKGKYILFELNKNYILVIHLRMTGHFNYYSSQEKKVQEKYLSAQFFLQDGSQLAFHEIRRFGRILFYTKPEARAVLAKVGPDPLQITSKQFQRILNTSPSAVIKSKLLDQGAISGVGNIYAQEALYHAKIYPLKKVQELSTKQRSDLHQALVKILNLAITQNGTTIQNYSHLDGKGDFQNFLAVYQKEKCPKNHILEKIKISGRTTSYCLKCQR